MKRWKFILIVNYIIMNFLLLFINIRQEIISNKNTIEAKYTIEQILGFILICLFSGGLFGWFGYDIQIKYFNKNIIRYDNKLYPKNEIKESINEAKI